MQGERVRTFEVATLTDLHHAVTRPLYRSTIDGLDEANSVDTQIHNIVASADSLEWDFDLRDLWLTSARWTTMVRQYVPPEQFLMWLDTCESKIGMKNRGIAMLRTNTVLPKLQSNGKVTRRWGSCMLAISYRAIPRPQITLHSRTSYLGYIGALDLMVAQTCGRYVAQALGVDHREISFVWMNEATQWHGFKSLAYLFAFDPACAELVESRELDKKQRRQVAQRPGLVIARKWMQKVRDDYEGGERMYGDEKYNTFLRIIRRYHTEVHGYKFAQQFESTSVNATEHGKTKKAYRPLPSCPADTLDFTKLDGVHTLFERRVGLPDDDPSLDIPEDADADDYI